VISLTDLSLFDPNILHGLPLADDGAGMRVQLAGDQHIVITIENQIGKFLIHESGDLGATARGVRWKHCQQNINKEPSALLELCARLRYGAILELVEARANLLGITTFRHRHLVPGSMQKFGKHYGMIFCQLGKFPRHYVAILVTDGGFKFALVEVNERDSEFGMGIGEMVIIDFGWVQAEKFLGIGAMDEGLDENDVEEDDMEVMSEHQPDATNNATGTSRKRKRSITDVGGRLVSVHPLTPPRDPFDISIRELRDLHAYCRARVAHIHIEHQLKTRSIPYVHVRPKRLLPIPPHIHANGPTKPVLRNGLGAPISTYKSPFMPYLPILCVQSSDLLAGAAAAEAAMPNIRIEPTEWWTLDKECMVNTSVQLKYVQPLDGGGGRTGASRGRNGEDGTMITPSENISYDPRTSVVTFLSRKVGDCVDEFLTEWARVSKVVVIARQSELILF
jgi:mediator of RNA polymerase II transcription subunit 14